MTFTLGQISFLFCATIWISVCSADEMVVQIFPNRAINYVSDKFISFSMSPTDLVDIYNNKRFSFLWFSTNKNVRRNESKLILLTICCFCVQLSYRDSFSSRMRELGPSHLKISGQLNQLEAEKRLMETDALKMEFGLWLYHVIL